jgi:hypothetical protein
VSAEERDLLDLWFCPETCSSTLVSGAGLPRMVRDKDSIHVVCQNVQYIHILKRDNLNDETSSQR